MATIMPLLQAVIVGGFALFGIVITQQWTTRREYMKRRVDLAEEVLALCYEAQDAIRYIRSPLWSSEGSTRQRRENETQQESDTLDRAYIVIERYNKTESTFKNLKAKKYIFMAAFRGDSHRPFETIDHVITKLRVASHMLGTYYWPTISQLQRPGADPFASKEQRERFLKEMQDQQAVFSAMHEPDPVTPVVAEAVRMVEAFTETAAKKYVASFAGWWRGSRA